MTAATKLTGDRRPRSSSEHGSAEIWRPRVPAQAADRPVRPLRTRQRLVEHSPLLSACQVADLDDDASDDVRHQSGSADP